MLESLRVLDLDGARRRVEPGVEERRVNAGPAAERGVGDAVGRLQRVVAVAADQRVDTAAANQQVIAVGRPRALRPREERFDRDSGHDWTET